MAVNLSPVGGVAAQFFDNSGNPLTGGKLYTYTAGTTTPAVTYTSSSGATAHPNPIVLDAAGRVPNSGEVWLTDGLQYKFVLKTSTDVLLATYDNIVGINSNFINFTNEQEIQTATSGQTVFTLTTMQYQPGTNSLSVFVDGVNQYGPGAQYAFLETDSTTVTFISGLHVGAEVKFTTSAINASSYGDAFQISYTPPFTASVPTNVGDKLAQTVSVKDFGAVGDGVTDDTAAIQAAIDAAGGRPILCPYGTYVVTSTLTYSASSQEQGLQLLGDGIGNTNFDNRVASGPMLSLLNDSNQQTPFAARLEGFSVITTTNPASSIGIQLTGQWFANLKRLLILGMSSDGIRIINNNADNDASAFFNLSQLYIRGNGGWGINCPDPSTLTCALGAYELSQVYSILNTSGGVRLLGLMNKITKSAISMNTGRGLVLAYSATAGQNTNFIIDTTEFDGNGTRQLDIESCVGGLVQNCKFIYTGSYDGIRYGNGGSGVAKNITTKGNQHLRSSGTVTLNAVTSTATNITIEDDFVSSTIGVTKITDAGTNTIYKDDGKAIRSIPLSIYTGTAGSGSYTPAVLNGITHRVVLDNPSFTVNNPTGQITDGQELIIYLINSTGGNATITMGAAFLNSTHPTFASGTRMTARFIYDASSSVWAQVGEWAVIS